MKTIEIIMTDKEFNKYTFKKHDIMIAMDLKNGISDSDAMLYMAGIANLKYLKPKGVE